MSILTDKEIKDYAKRGMISPFIDTKIVISENGVNCPSYGLSHCGYDVVLQPKFSIGKKTDKVLSILENNTKEWFEEVNANSIIVPPKGLVLSVTKEHFRLPTNIVGSLFCKSTLARMGIWFPPTIAEPGWEGELVVEILNGNDFPVEIHAGVGIGQMIFFRLDSSVDVPYNGKYQHQKGVTHATMSQRDVSEIGG